MNTIDPTKYRADFTPLERHRYINAVLEAFERGEELESCPAHDLVPLEGASWVKSYCSAHDVAASAYQGFSLVFRIKPAKTAEIAEGHNPGKLTEQHVGVADGWRLLTEEELLAQAGNNVDGCQYRPMSCGWWEPEE